MRSAEHSGKGSIVLKRVLGGVVSLALATLLARNVAGEQERINNEVKPNLSGLTVVAAGARNIGEPKPVETPSTPNFNLQVEADLKTLHAQFEEKGLGWRPLMTELVQISITEPEGVYLRSQPDQESGTILGGLSYDNEGQNQGDHNSFVMRFNEKTGEASLWVAQPGKNGPEYYCIYLKDGSGEREFAGLKLVGGPLSGQSVLAGELVERFLPLVGATSPSSTVNNAFQFLLSK